MRAGCWRAGGIQQHEDVRSRAASGRQRHLLACERVVREREIEEARKCREFVQVREVRYAVRAQVQGLFLKKKLKKKLKKRDAEVQGGC